VTFWDDRSSAPFVLTAIGLGFVIVGVYIVSNVRKEPLYDVMLAWDPQARPSDREAGRRRYLAINWIQAAATWTAFALLLVALVSGRRPPQPVGRRRSVPARLGTFTHPGPGETAET
jgi:hypothetical protein